MVGTEPTAILQRRALRFRKVKRVPGVTQPEQGDASQGYPGGQAKFNPGGRNELSFPLPPALSPEAPFLHTRLSAMIVVISDEGSSPERERQGRKWGLMGGTGMLKATQQVEGV